MPYHANRLSTWMNAEGQVVGQALRLQSHIQECNSGGGTLPNLCVTSMMGHWDAMEKSAGETLN